MNDVIYAGYYTTELFDYAEHTYAIAETQAGEKVHFGCYGGTSGENNRVPATLYTGTMLKSLRRSIGKKRKSDLFKARCIAQFSIDPEIKTHYDSKPPNGPFGLGDNSGIVYGVTGVCHQMCNRILHAMDYRSFLFRSPGVVWPPSFDLSRILYLNDGSMQSQIVWKGFLELLQRMKEGESLARNIVRELHETLKQTFVTSLKAHLRDGYSETASREMINLTLLTAKPELDWQKQASWLIPGHFKLLKEKKDLDHLLLKGSIVKQEYCSGLNTCLTGFIRSAEEKLGGAVFKKIFGFKPGASLPGVVTVEDMPDIDGYGSLGEEMKL